MLRGKEIYPKGGKKFNQSEGPPRARISNLAKKGDLILHTWDECVRPNTKREKNTRPERRKTRMDYREIKKLTGPVSTARVWLRKNEKR